MPSGVYKHIGRKHTPEAIEKIRQDNLKHPRRFWLGKKRPEMKNVKGFGFKKGQVGFWKGKHHSEITKKKIREARAKQVITEETKIKIGLANSGEKSHLWRGGISTINDKARHNFEMGLWRKAVLERDNFTCQKYGTTEKLVVHHIINFSDFPELRTSIENGITFSQKAHEEFHKKYGKKNNTREQIIEFLSI